MSNDSWRPKLHVAPYSGSISDPNGLCQFKGTYHFFCQNAPTYPGDVDSPHGWGHFATRDLVHYTFLGCHIFPGSPADKDGSYSGGAFVNEDADEVWFYYTGNIREPEGDGTYSGRLANQTLMRSYNGINMEGKQVVLDNSGYPAYCSCHVRDPKVWKQDGKLHMLLGARTRKDSRGAVMMYDSDDGYTWEMAGSVTNLDEKPFGYMWECPDRVVLDGHEYLSTCPQGMAKAIESQDSTRTTAQNVHGAGYFPIDGKLVDLLHKDTGRMEADAPRAAIDQGTFVDWDYGFDFYACQSFVDEKGRTMLIGWMSLPHDEDDVRAYDNPTETWRGVLTVPRVLTRCQECGKILQAPPAEIDALRGDAQAFDSTAVLPQKCADVVIDGIEGRGSIKFGDFLELRFEDDGVARLEFTNMNVSGGRKLRQAPVDELRNVRVLVDTSVLEIFVNDGAYVFGTRYFDEADGLTVSTDLKAAHKVWYPMDEVSVNYLVSR